MHWDEETDRVRICHLLFLISRGKPRSRGGPEGHTLHCQLCAWYWSRKFWTVLNYVIDGKIYHSTSTIMLSRISLFSHHSRPTSTLELILLVDKNISQLRLWIDSYSSENSHKFTKGPCTYQFLLYLPFDDAWESDRLALLSDSGNEEAVEQTTPKDSLSNLLWDKRKQGNWRNIFVTQCLSGFATDEKQLGTLKSHKSLATRWD